MATSTAPIQSAVARRFRFDERETNLRTEILGGVATFLTMSYIVFVNPAILSAAGVPFDAVTVATAIAAALFTFLMGVLTNLPFALAPGLGLNAVVAFDIILGRKVPWPVGMACVVIEGLLAVVLVLAGLGDLTSGPALIALAGILVALVLTARGIKGSILYGIGAATVLGLIFGVLDGPSGVVEMPGSDSLSTIGDALAPSTLADALTWALIPVIFSLFMTDFFDTVGTAFAVGNAAGLTNDRGEIPNTRRLLLVDSAAAAGGGAMGVSSVTTYVESGAGVSEGARTGLGSVVTAACFVLTVFFVPIVALVGQSVKVGDAFIPPAIAPALV